MSLIKIIVAIVLVTLSLSAGAADVFLESGDIHLDGEIRNGDAERVVTTILEAKKLDSEKPRVMLISSNGGDINESMKIVSIVKGTYLTVAISQGKVCASSCFFIYLAGIDRIAGDVVNSDGTLISQEERDKSLGAVGIHRPYFKDPSGNPESQKKQIILMRKVKTYLEEEGVSEYLIDTMMARPSNEIYWLNIKEIYNIGQYPPDIEETAISKCGYKRVGKLIEEDLSAKKNDTVKRSLEMAICIRDNVLIKFDNSRSDYISKLSTGWRPWKK